MYQLDAVGDGMPIAQQSGCVPAVEPLLRVLSMGRVAVAVLNDGGAPKGGAKEEEKDERTDVLSFEGPVRARVTIRREDGARHDPLGRRIGDDCRAASAAAMRLGGNRAGAAMGKRGVCAGGDRATVTSDRICREARCAEVCVEEWKV